MLAEGGHDAQRERKRPAREVFKELQNPVKAVNCTQECDR
jgi:hypothetical protein